jgi:hypothetical protein
MADTKEVARSLAEKAIKRYSKLEDKERMQLHRARILDAESNAFWKVVVAELTAGIEEYDKAIAEAAFSQKHVISSADASTIVVAWRQDGQYTMSVRFDFERRRIEVVKSVSAHATAMAHRAYHLQVEDGDVLSAHLLRDGKGPFGEPIGDPAAVAQSILEFMLAGSF